MNKNRTAIDLFAGAGGLSTGLELAGLDILFANEISPSYSESLKFNHPNTEVLVGDIRDIKTSRIRKELELAKGELDLLVGGPPCQGFSINAPIRSEKDHRNHLFLSYLSFVEEFEPKVVLIENVPGMVSFSGGETIRAILASLEQLGYEVTVRILYAPHYGVPQMRWRTIFLASNQGIPSKAMLPIPTHSASGRANFTNSLDGEALILSNDYVEANSERQFTSVAEAITDLPKIENKGGQERFEYTEEPRSEYQKVLRQGSEAIFNHHCSGLGRANLDRLPHIPPGGSWRDIPFELLPKGMKRARRSDHTKRYGRLDPDGLASTILTKCDPHWGTYIHPDQDRVLSVREAARLQAFPDRVRFFGSLTEQYEQVGNAVPPLFAKAIGDQILEVLGSIDKGTPVVSGLAGKTSQHELTL